MTPQRTDRLIVFFFFGALLVIVGARERNIGDVSCHPDGRSKQGWKMDANQGELLWDFLETVVYPLLFIDFLGLDMPAHAFKLLNKSGNFLENILFFA